MILGEKSKDSHYVIDEEEAETVRLIYELCIKGYGIKKIKHYLEGANPDNKKYLTADGNTKWFESTIQRVLHRTTYMGKLEHFQSVTENPLTHERKKVDKNRHVEYDLTDRIPCIIEPEIWYKAQESIAERTNENWKLDSTSYINGKVVNKNVFCKKMRCGCGRRFKFDLESKDYADRGTFRCYELVEDGSQKLRKEKSDILDDNCSIYGIRDWILDFVTLEVFKYLECDFSSIKKRLIKSIERAFVSENEYGYSETDVLKFKKEIENLNNKNERLLDGFEDGIYSKEKYLERKNKNDAEIIRLQQLIDSANDTILAGQEKEQTMEAVYRFLDEALAFPKINETKIKVPEALIETYVNSIKVCKDNNYEFNIRVAPEAPIQVPIKPDEEFNPQFDSAKLILDNQDAVLIGEFELTYEDAKSYTSIMNGKYKVKKARFEKPISVRIYANL